MRHEHRFENEEGTMGDLITLKEYEDAELDVARRDARRGFVLHALMAAFSVVVHYVALRRVEASLEARHRKIEEHAGDMRSARARPSESAAAGRRSSAGG